MPALSRKTRHGTVSQNTYRQPYPADRKHVGRHGWSFHVSGGDRKAAMAVPLAADLIPSASAAAFALESIGKE